ncbi:hypothetical protein [Pantoea sp. C2G6]|uniref:hypothetical protein n=1 Tax=Pantoea sp. C2G6 TaxID=3243084 RepID=UPI003EDA128A
MNVKSFIVAFFALFFFSPLSLAMVCHDQLHQQIFYIDESSGYSYQIGFPANNGISQRDPTGQYYMRLQAANPFMEAYFASWDRKLVLLRVGNPGPMIIGFCNQQTLMGTQPVVFIPELTSGNYQVIGVPANAPNIPKYFSPTQPGYIKMVYATQKNLESCLNNSKSKNDFLNCSVESLFPQTQRKIYKCVVLSDNEREECIAAAILGQNEQKIYHQVRKCYEKHDGNIEEMPLCMASQQFNEDTQQAIQCAQEQLQEGQFSAWGTIACVGGSRLKMNKEMTIAVQCATTSGGDPWVWAGCTGGQLTKNEIEKCFSSGIGGENGCFGDNNTIVQYLRKAGEMINSEMGSNNELSIVFNNAINDISNGPGPSNDIVEAANTVVNDLHNGPGEGNDIRKTLNQIFPGIW